jgi:membrane protein implicated in regulation of membrane protease activity
MTDQDEEIAALKARLAAIEGAPKPSVSAASLLGRGALLVVAICCALLLVGGIQVLTSPGSGWGDFVLAVVVALIAIVCAWLAFRKSAPK